MAFITTLRIYHFSLWTEKGMAFESIITVGRDKCKHMIIGSICRTVGYPEQEIKLLTVKKVLVTMAQAHGD